MGLDNLDLKVIHELGMDARQSNSQIGKKIGKSQQVVGYRIKQLMNKKVITEFFTVIHFGAFGYSNYVVMIKLQNSEKEEQQKLVKELYQKDNVLLISECGGRWDLIVNLVSDSPSNFEKDLSKIVEEYSDKILSYDLFISFGGYSFGRKYIHEQKNQRKPVSFGKENVIKLSAQDMKILKAISRNARKSALELESEIKINYKTIIRKIKDLKKQGIVTGFRPFIDVFKIGYFPSKIFLDLNMMAQNEEEAFNDFLYTKKNVVGTLKMIGKWNYSITIETKDQKDTWRLYKEIQDYLGDKIKSIELVPIFKKHEYRYFPEVLLK